jgi:multiple sugar transport system substrate-binding protein
MNQFRLGRRPLLALGGLAGAAAITGCGGNTGRDEGGDGDQPVLQWWLHQYGEAGTQEAATRYADEYPDADVRLTWVPGDYDARLASGLNSQEGPDAFEGHLNRQMVTSGQIVPLDDLIADVRSDYGEVDLNMNTVDGQLYGIKMINDPQLFYYRRSLLEDAGLQPPTTMEELAEVAAALTNDDVKGLFVGNDGGVGRAIMVMAATGQPLLNENNEIGFEKDRTIQGVLEFRDAARDDVLLLGAPTDWWDPSAFVQGLCAVTWQGLWATPAILDQLGDDVGAFPMPATTGGQQAVYNGGWTAFVSARARDVEAAKAFTKWLWVDNTELQLDWCLSYGFHIPPRRSLAAQATELQNAPAADVLALSETHGFGDFPNWTPAMNTALEDFFSRVVREGADPEPAYDAMVETVQRELDALFG